MKPSEIVKGGTYVNKGAGRTTRLVLDLGEHVEPPKHYYSQGERPGGPCVHYEDNKGRQGYLYLKSFAAWCGKRL
jgi:hypothetical protein